MADGKKCRKVLQFNEYDFRHKQTLDILSKHPRGMTELVVNAILHYVVCPEANLEFNRDSIKEIVEDVLREMQANGTLQTGQPSSKTNKSDFNADDLNELSGVMSMFRNRG